MCNVISMFAGIGGICLGFKQAGFNITWANEFDTAACKTYRHYFGNEYLVENDIRKINTNDIPDADIVAAGFPCQSFSIAGKQRGFNDRRGNLFFEVTRIIESKKPSVVFLENVPNLIEHDDGKTFLVIHNILSQLGYYIRYAILPAYEYGNLPQYRSRIYIVAFKNLELCEMFKFPEKTDLTYRVADIVDINNHQREYYYYSEVDDIFDNLNLKVKQIGRIYNMHNAIPQKPKYDLCPTLVASMGSMKNRVPVVRDIYGIRRLTLRECLDFQGFPRDYTFPNNIKIKDAYKQIGNSVCVPVVKRIAEQIKKVIE